MTTRTPSNPPERIGLIPDREAVKHLTAAVLQGNEELPQATLAQVCVPVEAGPRWEADPVRELIDEAMERFQNSPTQADAWMAPRLHTTLRLTRREAADPSLWNFLALRLAPDYVLFRHPGRPSRDGIMKATNQLRFSGPFHTQTFARLWWAAELFRNASDYRPVELACGNQDVLHTALRLDVVLHRPTAQAIVRMLERQIVRTGRDVNALAQAINAAGSTLFFEVLAPDDSPDVDAYRSWLDDAGSVYAPFNSLPDGPHDGAVPSRAVDGLSRLFEKLFNEAPVRGRRTNTDLE